MKSSTDTFFRRNLFCSFALTVLAMRSLSAAAASDQSAAEPKTHMLFMGADVSVVRDKQSYRVKDVSRGSFVITVKGEPVYVPMDNGPVRLNVTPSLMLSELSATVAELKEERVYTAANDPQKKFLREQPGSTAMAQVGLAEGTYGAAMGTQQAAAIMAQTNPIHGPAAVARAQVGMSTAMRGIDNASRNSLSDFNSVGFHAGRMEEELEKKLFDAMSVSFRVSSDKPLNHPYVVIVTTFRDPDSKPGEVQNWIYARELSPIDETPREVRVVQGGFPPGFEVTNNQVHVYNRGIEVATNVASRRVPLTRDEALQYLLLDYVGSHKDATLPPSPTMVTLPEDLHRRIVAGQFGEPVYVKVSPTGKPLAAFLDASCSRPADDPYLTSVIKDLRFKPALEKGKPVEAVAEIKLAKLL